MKPCLTFQYTLTETHLGGAGANGSVDLPIVRESTTELPFLPETALKGLARRVWPDEGANEKVERYLFGRHLDDTGTSEERSDVGHLSFTQGHLLFYPLRSLQRPFVLATCPLLLSRFSRLTRSFGCEPAPPEVHERLQTIDNEQLWVAHPALADKDLVLEGIAWQGQQVRFQPELKTLARMLAEAFPDDESATAKRIEEDLVLVPDGDFVGMLGAAPPVRARISIDPDTGTTSGRRGNLWYEEMLPSDCLFWSIVSLASSRRESRPSGGELRSAVDELFQAVRFSQIGAGRSTGHGRIWWWRHGS